ncbi:hypothetical protein [Peribacillus frigoritolerans]|uniref:hypothetical protein n=1 Tax=Peribacillus frigoritolerans TaxID=450367 RepID=UPI002E1D35E0|nr:hypothetical protein [Peribacillus frigoritolerans]
MKIDVYTYDDPRRWRHHSQYNKIKNAIHICATKNMADGIMDAYQNVEEQEFRYVFTIREIIDELLSRWSLPEEQLKQYLTLSRVISEHNTDKVELKDAFKNNRSDLLETIRFLTYTGVKPADLSTIDPEGKKLTDKEKLFQQIWFEVEEEDSTYKSIRKKLRRGWTTKEVKVKLNMLLEEQKKSTLDFDINKMVLHGFYFITPEQQIFLQALRKAGFEIIFFNFYDQRFSETFDFTRAFISEQFQWTDDWKIESNRGGKKESLGSKFLSAFEGEDASKRTFQQEIIRYDSFFEFLNEVIVPNYPIGKPELERDDVQIIATNADMLNDILVQYYPDKFAERRNFLQYPIGQFISKIHQMIDGNTFILNEDILISTFSSGWLYNPITKKNARDYTFLLKQLLPFFGNCHTFKGDWLPRFSELLEHYDEILPAFEEPDDDRIVTSIRNPITKIAHFSLTRKQVEDVHYFVEQLVFIAEELFNIQAKEAPISEHFKKLLAILDKRNPTKHSKLLPGEVDIITLLNQKLKRIKDDNFFLYDDVGEAINVYLSGKLSKRDESFIKPFIEVDGEAFKQNISTFYLTGLDEKGLPLDEFSTPWPLQEVTFEKLSIRHEVLELNTLRNKSVKQISRYLLFIALEFLLDKNMELSWMRNFLDRKNLQPAVYVHQLGLKIKDYQDKENHHVEETRPNSVDFKNIELEPNDKALTELTFTDFLVEYNQCARRFYFSYILSSSPVFTDEFIHQFMYSDLIRLVKRSTALENSQVIKTVGNLFPQWTDYKKETIAETYISSAGKSETLEQVGGNINVSKARKNFQLPGLKNYDRDRLVEETIKKKPSLLNNIKEAVMNETILPASPGIHCHFCPHLDTCSEGKHPID